MFNVVLTQSNTFIIGPVAKLLGYLMEGIFYVLNMLGIPNIGLSIIFFTIIIYLLMMPLTIKQQKFSKLSAKMNPELQAVQKKYKGKKDNDSMMKMNEETQAIYAKYGVSPTGSCVQLIIQMPILFALYKVIYAIPAYVGQVKEAFFPLVDNLISQAGSSEFLQTFKNAPMYAGQFTNDLFTGGNTEFIRNTYIDVLNKASSAELQSIVTKFPSLSSDVTNTVAKLDQYNNFFGLNMGNSPSYVLSEALANGAWLLVVGALMIPIFSAVTQWVNVKLMPQPAGGDSQSDTMANSMKTMNMAMPIMSAVMCFSLPSGVGLYWIAGAVVRCIQQILINKHIDKMDLDALMEKNREKASKKLAKNHKRQEMLNGYASMNTKNLNSSSNNNGTSSSENKEETVRKATEYYNNNAKPGSLAAKANMVRQYNEKNNK